MGNSEEKDTKNMIYVYCVSPKNPARKITIISHYAETYL